MPRLISDVTDAEFEASSKRWRKFSRQIETEERHNRLPHPAVRRTTGQQILADHATQCIPPDVTNVSSKMICRLPIQQNNNSDKQLQEQRSTINQSINQNIHTPSGVSSASPQQHSSSIHDNHLSIFQSAPKLSNNLSPDPASMQALTARYASEDQQQSHSNTLMDRKSHTELQYQISAQSTQQLVLPPIHSLGPPPYIIRYIPQQSHSVSRKRKPEADVSVHHSAKHVSMPVVSQESLDLSLSPPVSHRRKRVSNARSAKPPKAPINPSFQPKSVSCLQSHIHGSTSPIARSVTGALKWEIENEPINTIVASNRKVSRLSIGHREVVHKSSHPQKTTKILRSRSSKHIKPDPGTTGQLSQMDLDHTIPAGISHQHDKIGRSQQPLRSVQQLHQVVPNDDSDRVSQFEQLVAQFAQQQEDRPRHVGLFVPTIIANKHRQ